MPAAKEIVFYNTATREKEAFKPVNENKAAMYSCGPTVYNYAHIGNLSSFVFSDILKRTLRYFGYEVNHVMNLTDVDDKTIKASREQGIKLNELTEKYTEIFLNDLGRLNIEEPSVTCKATEHIEVMLELIQKLIDKGIAYERDGSVYFSLAKFPNYGKFAHLDPEAMANSSQAADGADDYEKDDVRDFALWKAWTEDDGDVSWETPWGKGRPGWHIECSAMSMKYLGETFDIHTGGIDLVFPHHTNEIAQSEAATGKPFVNCWMHKGFITMSGEKMAKRDGNTLVLNDIAETPLEDLAYRLLVLSSHYRSQLNYTDEILEQYKRNLVRILELYHRLQEANLTGNDDLSELIEKAKERFDNSLADDLATPEAMAAIYEFVTETNKRLDENLVGGAGIEAAQTFLDTVDSVLGVIEAGLPHYIKVTEPTAEQIEKMKKLDQLRADKKYEESDQLRAELKEEGLDIQITKEGTTGKRKVFQD
jgi:cysteinyl-tRNA synthetase